MPSKAKIFRNVAFSSDTIREASNRFSKLGGGIRESPLLTRSDGTVTWKYDELEVFLGRYREGQSYALCVLQNKLGELQVHVGEDFSRIEVRSPTESEIEEIFDVFERDAPTAATVPTRATQQIFVGHGRDTQWRDLKDHLSEKHEYEVVAYEIGSRSGHTIRDILQGMLENSSFAILVFTGEDEMADGAVRARQNVVHETGLFQGKLGFDRAVVLVEEGVEIFSNLDGVQQIRFAKQNIRESFGDVLAVLHREKIARAKDG